MIAQPPVRSSSRRAAFCARLIWAGIVFLRGLVESVERLADTAGDNLEAVYRSTVTCLSQHEHAASREQRLCFRGNPRCSSKTSRVFMSYASFAAQLRCPLRCGSLYVAPRAAFWFTSSCCNVPVRFRLARVSVVGVHGHVALQKTNTFFGLVFL